MSSSSVVPALLAILFVAPVVPAEHELLLMGIRAQERPDALEEGMGGANVRRFSRIVTENGGYDANIEVLERHGRAYVRPEALAQVFPGTTVEREGDYYFVRRPDGSELALLVLNNFIAVFLGDNQGVELIPYQSEGAGNDYLPLEDIGAFYKRDITRQHPRLVVVPRRERPEWLSSGWDTTLRDTGLRSYHDNIGSRATVSGGSRDRPVEENVFRGITATVFSSVESGQKGAYGEYLRPGDSYVALPFRFKGKRPKVAVRGPNGTVVAPIKDVGPWNIDDPYWIRGSRPQAETGRDKKGRRTNLAGIDLSPRLGKQIGIGGKGQVDWWFVDG